MTVIEWLQVLVVVPLVTLAYRCQHWLQRAQWRLQMTGWWLRLYKCFKWMYRMLVSHCSELERICSRPLPTGEAAYQVHRSLLYSTQLRVAHRQLETDNLSTVAAVHQSIRLLKRFRGLEQSTAAPSRTLFHGLQQIRWTFLLLIDVNGRAATRYDSSNAGHEKKLLDLYQLLRMPEPLSGRLSEQWKQLGFQGADPATDFRGMGVLGLEQLVCFARRHGDVARQSLTSSQHPVHWYQWACVGINLTAFLVQLLRSRKLQRYLFWALERSSTVQEYLHAQDGMQDASSEENQVAVGVLRDAFHELYCVVFHRLDRQWNEWAAHREHHDKAEAVQRPMILEFPRFFSEFKQFIEEQLWSTAAGPAWTTGIN